MLELLGLKMLQNTIVNISNERLEPEELSTSVVFLGTIYICFVLIEH